MKIKTSIIAMVMLLSTFVPKANAVTNAELTTLLQKYCIPKSTNTCVNCPLSYDEGVSTENKCNCGGGKFYKPTERDCDICQTGYFSKGYDVDKCTPCANGYYADAEKLSECKKCPAGYKCPQTITKQTPVYKKVIETVYYECNPYEVSYTYDCNPYRCGILGFKKCYRTCTGTKTVYATCEKNVEKTVFSHYEYEYRGAITATKCEAGTYSTAGASSCSTCPAGYYCPGGTDKKICSAGTYSSAGASSCSTCPKGYYCPGGTDKKICPAGSYCPNTGMSTPTSCSNMGSRYYQPNTGATTCSYCSDDYETCDYVCGETCSDCNCKDVCTGYSDVCRDENGETDGDDGQVSCSLECDGYEKECDECCSDDYCDGTRTLYYKVSSDRKSCVKYNTGSCS